MPPSLYQHQERLLVSNPPRKLLCWDTGTGKTLTAILWAKQNFATRILVVMPKALKQNWVRNVLAYDGNRLNSWTFLTKEEFKKVWEDLENHEVVIVDEAHHFAGTKSQQSRLLGAYFRKWKVPYRLLLTATPYRSSPWDVYTLAKHLGHDWNWFHFFDRFFTEKYVGRGKKVPAIKVGIEADIATVVSQIGDVVHLQDCADIPEQVFETEEFGLSDAQLTKKLSIADTNPIVRFTRHHEIENGFLKSDGYEEDWFTPSQKEDRILALVEEHPKIIIVCRYHGQLARLEALIKEVSPHPVFVIHGGVKDRDTVVRMAESADGGVVLIQAACSEGYELPSYPVMVFASLDFSYVNYKQMLGRILRINKLKKNVYLHLVSNGIDKAVYDAIMKKQDFDIAIYARDTQITGSEGVS